MHLIMELIKLNHKKQNNRMKLLIQNLWLHMNQHPM